MPSAADPMQVLAAALAPVVLVSATAILISGVNSRYISIADRIRSLAQEFRSNATAPSRRSAICDEMRIFSARIRLVAWAVRTLYAAVGCFIAMVLMISVTLWRQMLAAASLPLFALGVLLMLAAIFFELYELYLSNRTISLEIRDISAD
jgi:hypothetical protein